MLIFAFCEKGDVKDYVLEWIYVFTLPNMVVPGPAACCLRKTCIHKGCRGVPRTVHMVGMDLDCTRAGGES